VSLLRHSPSLSPTLWMAMISRLWFLLLQVKRALMPKQSVVSLSSTKIPLQLSLLQEPTCPKLFYSTYLQSILAEERAWWTSLSSIFGNSRIAMQLELIFSISKMQQVRSQTNLKLIQN
jgi:hypothetical protein